MPENTAIAVVIGPEHDDVSADARANFANSQVFVQKERRGTAHAVLAAKSAIEQGADDIVVVFGDTPLIRPQTLDKLRGAIADGAAVAVLGFKPADPTGYGRLVTQGTELIAIVEHADASEEERAIALCNGGLMAFDGKMALKILERIGNANRKGEFYLTDAVKIARDMKLRAVALEVTEDEVSGINTKAQLAATEATMQQRLRQAALEAGVTLVAPDTVYLVGGHQARQGRHGRALCGVRPRVTVEDGATIRSFSHLAGAHVGRNAIVGPYARLRPGAKLEEDVHIGNFVEVKEATIEAGAKANHLTLHRRRAGGRGRQYRRRHHHLQLRRRRQAPHRHRQRRLHRLEFGAGGAGQDRRRRLCRVGLGDHRRRARRRAGARTWPANR